MKVEYLVLIDSKEEYCKSIVTFNNLLQSYDGITINGSTIKYDSLNFLYAIQLYEPGNNSQRSFHLTFNSNGNEIHNYQSFLKLIKNILFKISGRPVEVLCDDVGTELCIKAYPIIHQIENEMRKLITMFMLTNVGIGWSKDNTPKEVSESIKTSNVNGSNLLYEVDFIQLSRFLFSPYAFIDSKKVIEKIKNANALSDILFQDLKDLVPISNWERYFASIVDCSSEFIDKRWQRLYELRCKVAHNKYIVEDEYNEINRLSIEVKEKIQKAIANLENIHISDEQKEEVAENVAENRNELYGKFIQTWNFLISCMFNLATRVVSVEDANKLGNGNNWRGIVNILRKADLLPKNFKNELKELAAFRNTLIHQADVIFTNESVLFRISNANNLINIIMNIDNNNKNHEVIDLSDIVDLDDSFEEKEI